MGAQITIAMAQANPTVGDIDGNLALARRLRVRGGRGRAPIWSCSPSCSWSATRPRIWCSSRPSSTMPRAALEQLAQDTADGGPALVVGAPWRERAAGLFNAAFVLQGGSVIGRVYKHDLPNYGVFDEKRVFAAGPIPGPVRLRCATATSGSGSWSARTCGSEDVAEGLAESGAELLLVLNGSPFEHGKQDQRLQLAVARVDRDRPAADLRQPGRRPGRAGVRRRLVRARRRPAADGPAAELRRGRGADRWRRDGERWALVERGALAPPPPELESIYRAMVLGLATTSRRTAFPASCSACPAASIRRCRRRLRSTRWGRSGCGR